MVRNREIYKQALIFRKQGFSYSEIAKICGVSKSTLSSWFSKKKFSKTVAKNNADRAAKENKQRISLLNKARNKELQKTYNAAKKQAEIEYKHYKHSPLFVAGLMLYVSEGDNVHKRLIRIANARAGLHVIFLKFAKEFMGVTNDQIHFWILLYPDLVESKCVDYWTKKLHLSKDQFYKNQVIEGRSKKRTLHYGVGNTIIGSTVLKCKLNRWIELATKELQK